MKYIISSLIASCFFLSAAHAADLERSAAELKAHCETKIAELKSKKEELERDRALITKASLLSSPAERKKHEAQLAMRDQAFKKANDKIATGVCKHFKR